MTNETTETNKDEGLCGGKLPRKPWTVRTVEVLAWAYFAATLCVVAIGLLRAAFHAHYRTGWPLAMIALLMLLAILFASMLHAVRRARFAWFCIPNCIFALALLALLVTRPEGHGVMMFVGTLAFGIAAIASFILLYKPTSKAWQKEVLATRGKGRSGLMVALSLFALVYAMVAIPSCVSSDRAYMSVAKTEAKGIYGRIVENNSARTLGGEWIDPAGFTNSTQFIHELMVNVSRRPDPEMSWCVAVNPPADPDFPVMFTDNVDVGELLKQEDGKRRLALTCPAERGAKCLHFCEGAVVVMRQDGKESVIFAGDLTPESFFGGEVPCLAPDTYFLTPRGTCRSAASRH